MTGQSGNRPKQIHPNFLTGADEEVCERIPETVASVFLSISTPYRATHVLPGIKEQWLNKK